MERKKGLVVIYEFLNIFKRECPIIRFLAHIVLYYFQNNLTGSEEEMNNTLKTKVLQSAQIVLLAYIDHLIGYFSSLNPTRISGIELEQRQNIIQFITMYTSLLPKNLQIKTYSQFLRNYIFDNSERTN